MVKRNEIETEDISLAISTTDSLTAAAKSLSDKYGVKVTRQTLTYWVHTEGLGGAYEDTLATSQRSLLTARIRASKATKVTKEVIGSYNNTQDLIDVIREEAHKQVTDMPSFVNAPVNNIGGKGITIELLFSDLQIGKVSSDYNIATAKARVDEYMESAMDEISVLIDQGFNLERIVLASLGDLVEHDKKHFDSSRGTENSIYEQVVQAQSLMLHRIIKPLVQYGVPIDFIGLAGNHDWEGSGLPANYAGRNTFASIMYAFCEEACKQAQWDVSFIIPEGNRALYELYGQTILYQHGCGIAATDAGLRKLRSNVSDQLERYINMVRIGDKHTVVRLDCDKLVVNGAFFGDREGTEYSGANGYSSVPAQLMFVHVKRKKNDRRSSIYYGYCIQLSHIYEEK